MASPGIPVHCTRRYRRGDDARLEHRGTRRTVRRTRRQRPPAYLPSHRTTDRRRPEVRSRRVIKFSTDSSKRSRHEATSTQRCSRFSDGFTTRRHRRAAQSLRAPRRAARQGWRVAAAVSRRRCIRRVIGIVANSASSSTRVDDGRRPTLSRCAGGRAVIQMAEKLDGYPEVAGVPQAPDVATAAMQHTRSATPRPASTDG
jgi:hypothetical protein